MFVLKTYVLVVYAIKWFVKQSISFLMSLNVVWENRKWEARL
jgi:hypothetical protein